MKKTYSPSFKLEVVQFHLQSKVSLHNVARHYGIDHSLVRRWVTRYRYHGIQGLEPATKLHYSPSFKLHVVKCVTREGLTDRQAEARFNLRSTGLIGKWLVQYHSGQLTKPLSETKRAAPMAKKSVDLPPADVPERSMSQDELIEELLYLRAENAYLKKLDALIQEEEAAARSKKRKRSKG